MAVGGWSRGRGNAACRERHAMGGCRRPAEWWATGSSRHAAWIRACRPNSLTSPPKMWPGFGQHRPEIGQVWSDQMWPEIDRAELAGKQPETDQIWADFGQISAIRRGGTMITQERLLSQLVGQKPKPRFSCVRQATSPCKERDRGGCRSKQQFGECVNIVEGCSTCLVLVSELPGRRSLALWLLGDWRHVFLCLRIKFSRRLYIGRNSGEARVMASSVCICDIPRVPAEALYMRLACTVPQLKRIAGS